MFYQAEPLFPRSSGLSPEESERLTAHPEPEPTRPRSPQTPSREQQGTSPAEPRAPPAPGAAAAGRKAAEEGREQPQPKAAKLTEASPEQRAVRAGDRDRAHGETLPQKPPGTTSQRPEEHSKPGLGQEGPAMKETPGVPSKPKSPEVAEAAAEPQSPAVTPDTRDKKPFPGAEAMEVGVEAHKRKCQSREEAPGSPEKKPRVAEPCQHQQAFREQPFPGSAVPRVPPLKVSTAGTRGAQTRRDRGAGDLRAHLSHGQGHLPPARPCQCSQGGQVGTARAVNTIQAPLGLKPEPLAALWS